MLISIGVCSTGSLVAIAYLRRDQIRTRGQLAFVVLSIVLLPVLVLRPSFTVAAIVLCTTGIIAVAAAARSERHARLLICFGSIVLGIGAMVRFDSFMGVVAAFLPFIAVAGVSIGWRRLLIAIAIVSGLLAVTSLSDHALNSSPEWSAYMKFNQVRGELSQSIDFERAMADPTDPAVAKLLADIGWTVDDVVLFNSWLFYDPKVYSTDHLSKVVSLVSGTSYNAPLSDSVLLVFRSQRPLWILSVSLGVAAAARRRWRNWVLILVQLAWCAAVFSYIAASQRFPDRISIPFYLALGIVLTLGMPLLLHERNPEQHVPTDRRQVLPALVAVACVLVTFHDFSDGFTPWQISRTNQVAITQYHKQLDGLMHVDPAGRFLCLGSVLRIEGTDALATTSGYQSNKVLCTGWPTGGPSFAQRQSALGSSALMLDTLTTDKHFFIVLYRFQVEVIERLYMRYLGLPVTLDEVGHIANGGIVCHVRVLT